MTRESQLIAFLQQGLQEIRTANGYRTDSGANVFLNLEYQLRPDVDCIILFPGKRSGRVKGEDVPPSLGCENVHIPMRLEAFVADDLRGTAAQAVKADLEQWLKGNRTLGDLCEWLDEIDSEYTVHEGETVFGFIQVGFTIFYEAPAAES